MTLLDERDENDDVKFPSWEHSGIRRNDDEARSSFRARLAAASYSRREMATVMVETLRALGYDVSAYDKAEFTDLDRCKSCNCEKPLNRRAR